MNFRSSKISLEIVLTPERGYMERTLEEFSEALEKGDLERSSYLAGALSAQLSIRILRLWWEDRPRASLEILMDNKVARDMHLLNSIMESGILPEVKEEGRTISIKIMDQDLVKLLKLGLEDFQEVNPIQNLVFKFMSSRSEREAASLIDSARKRLKLD